MLAEWSMEPAAVAWEPCDLQLANWSIEPAVYSTGLPMDYAIFGNYCLQTSVPSVSKGGQQLVEYAAADRSECDGQQVETTEDHQQQEFVIGLQNMEKIIRSNPIHAFKKVADEYKIDIDMMGKKIHRYPASIKTAGLRKCYTTPMVVSIGPYHHGREGLEKAEKAKHVAAYCCIKASGLSPEVMYGQFVQAAHRARGFYADEDAVEGMSEEREFLPMMFFDACFLVQYMLIMSPQPTGEDLDKSLCSFMEANDTEILHDVMLLENQVPWFVVEAVMEFVRVPVHEFAASLRGCLQDRKTPSRQDGDLEETILRAVSRDPPPHLLGLLRSYIVGESRSGTNTTLGLDQSSISFSVSAVELAELGIALKPTGETTPELVHMGFQTKGTLFAELSLAPLSLTRSRASWLINMVAHELCATPNFREAPEEASAVCSYLLLLAMLVGREDDVQELRAKRLLQGGGGLNDAQALEFLAGVQDLRLGSRYVRIMGDIEKYRNTRRTRTSVHAFFYNNFKVIAAVISAIVTIVSILGTLLSIKN